MLRTATESRPEAFSLSILTLVMFAGVVLVLVAACAPKTRPATSAVPPPTPAVTVPAAAPAAPAGVGPAPAPVPSTPPPAPARPPAPAPLLGHLTEVALRQYAPWEAFFATPYVPDAAAIETIRARSRDVTVLMIMATWCPDSKRELPRFFAIIKAAGLSDSVLTMVGVDRTKKDAEGLTERWGITRVPTFVFLREGREVGRVVERTPPGSTLEAEIARALSGGDE